MLIDEFYQSIRLLLPTGEAMAGIEPFVDVIAKSNADFVSFADQLISQQIPNNLIDEANIAQWLKLTNIKCIAELSSNNQKKLAVLAGLKILALPYSNSSTVSLWALEQIGIVAGFDVKVSINRPFKVGQKIGGSSGNNGHLQINIKANNSGLLTRYTFKAGNKVGMRLKSFNSKFLECIYQQMSPAHLILDFNYL